MTKAKAIRDTIRRINEITDRAADDWLHTSLQNKPIPSHPIETVLRKRNLIFCVYSFSYNGYLHNLSDQYRRKKDMRITERLLIVIAAAITAVSALFCIIGLTTKGWGRVGIIAIGLFCNDICNQSSAALSVISFILLIVSLIAFALVIFGILNGVLRLVPFIVLFIATIFLLATFASYSSVGYSYNLMVVAHFFSYIALAVTAYWCGQSDATSGSTG